MPSDSSLSSSQRVDWSKGDRATYYREQAGRFQQLADMEAQPHSRERLLEMAEQYTDLADRVARSNTPKQSPSSHAR